MEDTEKSNEIFISYRRADVEFTKTINEGLKKEGLTVWVDWDDIPPGVEGFSDEIQRGIEGAVAFICILSPSYLESEYCLMELREALRLKKRIIPVVLKKFEPTPAPEGIGHINWVYFTPHAGQENTFKQSFPKVIQAIKADYEYSREHTKLFLRANDWQKNGKGKGYLLTTGELEKAEHWQSTAAGKDPPPTELHGQYILASRKDATRRQRITLAGVAVALLVSIVLGLLAVNQWQNAVQQARISHAGELAALSISEKDQRFDLSLLFGIEAFKTLENSRTKGVLFSLIDSHPGLEKYLFGHTDTVATIAFSPDKKRMASGSADHTIDLWDVSNPAAPVLLSKTNGDESKVINLVFSSDGTRLTSIGDDNTVIQWNISNSAEPTKLSSTKLQINETSAGLSADGTRMATTSSDNESVHIWDISNPSAPAQIATIPASHALTVAFSSDGSRLALDDGTNIEVWNIENSASSLIARLQRSTTGAPTMVFSADGRRLAVGGYRTPSITLWDLSNPASPIQGAQQITDEASLLGLSPMVFSSDGNRLVAAGDTSVIITDISNLQFPNKLVSLTGQSALVTNAAFSPDGQHLISGSSDGSIIIWNAQQWNAPSLNNQISLANNIATSMALSSKRQLLASGVDSSIELWDIKNPSSPVKIGSLPINNNSTFSLYLNPDGDRLISVDENNFIVWDISNPASPSQITNIPMFMKGSYAGAFSADGNQLALASKGAPISIWNVNNPKTPSRIANLPDATKGTDRLAFNPDGKWLASTDANGTTIALWNISNLSSNSKPVILSGHESAFTSIAFSHDGNTLAFSSYDATYNVMILWDVSNPTVPVLLATMQGPSTIQDPYFLHLAFSQDDKQLITSSFVQQVNIWDMDPQSWVMKACQRAGRNFTRLEWAQYFPTEQYRKTCDQWPLETEILAQPAVNPTNVNPTQDTSLATQPPSNAQILAATEPPTTAPTQVPVDLAISTETPPVEGVAPTEPPAATEVPTTSNTYTEEFDGNLDAWTRFMVTGVDRQVDATLANGSLEVKLSPYQDKEPRVYWVNNSYTYTDVQVDMVTTNFGNNANGAVLICQYSDLGWYGFTISNSGLYAIYGFDPNRVGDDRFIALANGGSPAIKFGQSTNTYTAVCKGNELSLSVNGTLVKSVIDKTLDFTQGKIGFGVISPQKLPVDLRLESVSVSIPQ